MSRRRRILLVLLVAVAVGSLYNLMASASAHGKTHSSPEAQERARRLKEQLVKLSHDTGTGGRKGEAAALAAVAAGADNQQRPVPEELRRDNAAPNEDNLDDYEEDDELKQDPELVFTKPGDRFGDITGLISGHCMFLDENEDGESGVIRTQLCGSLADVERFNWTSSGQLALGDLGYRICLDASRVKAGEPIQAVSCTYPVPRSQQWLFQRIGPKAVRIFSAINVRGKLPFDAPEDKHQRRRALLAAGAAGSNKGEDDDWNWKEEDQRGGAAQQIRIAPAEVDDDDGLGEGDEARREEVRKRRLAKAQRNLPPIATPPNFHDDDDDVDVDGNNTVPTGEDNEERDGKGKGKAKHSARQADRIHTVRLEHGVEVTFDGPPLCLRAPDTYGYDGYMGFGRDKEAYVRLVRCRKPSCHQGWKVPWHLQAPTEALMPDWVAERKARALARRKKPQRILCWVMTDPKNLYTKAVAVNTTWASDCDTLLFMTTVHHPLLNTVRLWLDAPESREMLWRKARAAWMHVFHHFLDKADWFMRVDDDSYVMMDNLRDFLHDYDHNKPHYLGRTMVAQPADAKFYGGGAGNIMSHKALEILGNTVIKEPDIFADYNTFSDDVEIALSLLDAGVPTEDTRDEELRERFFPLGVDRERDLRKEKFPDHWYWRYSLYPAREGLECCSKRWIVSHYTSLERMYILRELHELGCEAAGRDPI
eukprot:m.50997 g.50997  ORF g.50997 m.50997 type:complete len:707 (+) comp6579_c0_seq1:276-2396(+)